VIHDDVLPSFPPLPAGAATPPDGVSMVRLVHAIDTAVMEVEHEDLRAVVLFENRELVDGYLERAGGVATGVEVLDELDGVPATHVRLHWLPATVVRALPRYWRLPSQLVIRNVKWMDGRLLLRSFARPRQSGVVCVRDGGGALGIAFVEQGDVLGCYLAGGDAAGSLEDLAALLEDPLAVLVARLESSGASASGQGFVAPPSVAPVGPVPGPVFTPRSHGGPLYGGPGLPVEEPPPNLRVLDDIELAIRSEIHDYADPAVAVFRSAPPTREGLLEAATHVERMRIRMISQERMQAIAERARQIIVTAC
jgi:hypothetical protein